MENKPRFDLFCLGGASVDLILRVPGLPLDGDKLVTEFIGRQPGGLVANAACAGARLGLRAGWAGYLGDDDAARVIRQGFSDFEVDDSLAEVLPGASSDFTVILLPPDGDRTILVANPLPGPPPLRAPVRAALRETQIAYSLPFALGWAEELAEAVHAAGGRLAMDVESSAPLHGEELQGALRASDLVFCSLGGLKLASGEADIGRGAAVLTGLGIETLVVTLGSKGARLYTRSGCLQAPAYPVHVVDTTGAGDCFHAAFLAGLLEDWPLDRCLRFASAAAALSVRAVGPRAGLPTRGDVERFLAAVGEGG